MQEKVEGEVRLWSRRNISLKGKVCVLHIYPTLYQLSVLPLTYTILMQLVRVLFSFWWGGKATKVCRDICYLSQCECDPDMPSVEISQHSRRIAFLELMCSQADGKGEFWKKDTGKIFQFLRIWHTCGELSHRLSRVECCSYRECRLTLKSFLQATHGFFDEQALSRNALYQVLVRGSV